MRVKFARLANFRNVGFADVNLDAPSVWICGKNGQGKTNLLEAVSLLTALRSFRSALLAPLIKFGAKEAAALFGIEHEVYGECEVCIKISAEKRAIFVNDEEQKKLSDFIGRFPAPAMCSDDMMLLRGAPALRRKFADMAFSAVDAEYLEALKGYHRALMHRAAALKAGGAHAHTLSAFEDAMARNAEIVWQKRALYFEGLALSAGQKYAVLAGGAEDASVKIKPDCKVQDAAQYARVLHAERAKDLERGAASSGPHKDDFDLIIGGKSARLYASEGQQRSAVLALKLAQFELFKKFSHAQPVLLCDDVLGELDEARRAAFWSCMQGDAQVIATSTLTSAPSDSSRKSWLKLRACAGAFETET